MEEEKQTIINVTIDDSRCDSIENAMDYVYVLEGVMWLCKFSDEFRDGTRNQVILAITVSCSMLGIDPLYFLRVLNRAGLIDYEMDDEDTEARMERMLCYENRFDYDYMLDPDGYHTYGKVHHLDHRMPIRLNVIDKTE